MRYSLKGDSSLQVMERFRGLNQSDEYSPERTDSYDGMLPSESGNFAMELCSEGIFLGDDV